MTKTRKKETIKKIPHSTFFADSLAALILIVFIILEVVGVVSIPFYYHVSVDIIISLIPAVITIITVAMQMQTTNTIRGIPLHEFERLRKKFHYGLLHMSLFFIAIFLCETLFFLFELRLCILVLDAISIIFSIIFLVQVMPVLSKNEKIIDSILGNYAGSLKTEDQIQDSFGNKAIRYTLMNYGIDDSLQRLSNKKTDKKKLLKTLLRSEIAFYNEVLSRTKEQIAKDEINVDDIDILKAIDSSYDDLEYLLIGDDPIVNELLADNSEFIYLTRMTWSIKIITDRIGYSEWNYKKTRALIDTISIKTYGKNPLDYPLVFRYLLLMSIYSVNEGQTWFIKAIRDRDFSPIFFDVIDTPLSFLLTMYICFFINSNVARKEYKDTILTFIDEQSKGINSAGYRWRNKVRNSLRNNMSGVHFLSGVVRMLKLKELLDDVYYEIRPEFGGSYTIDDSTSFDNELFFDYCFQVLVSNHFYDLKNVDLDSFLGEITPKNKDIFKKTFERRWKNIESRKTGFVFYNFVYNTDATINLENNAVYSLLSDYINKANKDEYDRDPSIKVNGEKIKDIKNRLDNKIDEIFANVLFKSDAVDDSETQKRFLYIFLDLPDYAEILDLYLKQFELHVNELIKGKVKEKAELVKHKLDSLNYESEMVREIINFNPDYFHNAYRYDIFVAKNPKPEGINPKRLEEAVLPRDTFIRDGAIRTKFEFLRNESIPRTLNDKEIEEMIDRDFTMINGYYRLAKYKGSDYGEFFVTRDELANYLKDRTVLVPIVFNCNVTVDETKILSFSFEESDDDSD